MIDSVSDADFQQGGDEPALDRVVQNVAKRYPTLAPYLSDARVQWGDPEEFKKNGGHLEFFPPWEQYNPNPGKVTLELYDRDMKGRALEDAIAGDMLHHLGSVDPNGREIDPAWRYMRDKVIAGRSPEAVEMDKRAYAEAMKNGEQRPFDQWMDQSRADAYVRGYITPDAADNWKDAYTPQQRATLEAMKAHLDLAPPSAAPDQNTGGLINSP